MKITVITPTYNGERFLAETIESVRRQKHTQWEMILVDDGSTDGTVALARTFAGRDARIRVVTQTNAGVAAARNRGLDEASPDSDCVIFLDHDDTWTDDALENLAAPLLDNPKLVAAHGLALQVNAQGDPFENGEGGIPDYERRKLARRGHGWRAVRCARTENTGFAVQVYDGCICTPGLMLARREAIERAGRFDPDIAPCDDWDLWFRLSLLGDIAFVDRVVLHWRQHDNNASWNREGMHRAVSQIRRKMISLPNLSAEQRAMAYLRYRRMFVSVARQDARDSAHWAGEALRQGRIRDSLCHLSVSLRCYARYVGQQLFWRDQKDHGPLPVRLKDQAQWEREKAGRV